MPVKNTTLWDKLMKNIKDVVFIIMFLSVALGWLRSSILNKADMKATIEANTKAIQNNTKSLEKFSDYINEQNKFNGQVIQHMRDNP